MGLLRNPPNRSALVLAALPPASVLAVDPSGWSPFTPAKWLAVTTLVLLGAAVALGPRSRGVARSQGPSADEGGAGPATAGTRLHRSSLVAFAAFVGWTMASAAFGDDHLYAWLGTPERHLGVLAWLLCLLAFVAGQTLRRAVDVVAVLTGLVVAGVGVGTYSIVEWVWRAPVALDVVTSRLGGPFGSAAYLGAACTLLGPAQVGITLDGEVPRWLRRAAAVGAALTLVALVGSGTRGAWLAVVGAAVVAVLVRVGWQRALVATAVVGLAAGALALVPRVRDVATRQGGAEGAARLDEWRVGARIALAHPVVGVGPEGYRIAFPAAVDAAYERAHGRAETPDRAHDAVLDIAAAVGLPGLALYGVLLALVCRLVWPAVRRAPPWRAGLAVALVAYLAQQLVLFPLAELEPVAWLLAGLVVAWEAALAPRPVTAPAEAVGDELSRPVDLGVSTPTQFPVAVAADRPAIGSIATPARVGAPIGGGRRPAVMTCVVTPPWRVALAALGVVALVAGALDLVADRAARTALRASSPAAAHGDRPARLRPDEVRYWLVAARTATSRAAALVQLDAARRLSPGDPIVRIERARTIGTLAAWREVTAHDPRNAAVWLRRGVAAANEGDVADAEQSWKTAEGLAPRSAVPAIDLSRLYLSLGRVGDARAAAQRAVERAPDDADALAARTAAAEPAGR